MHQTQHHIVTTLDPPVAEKPRRLPSEKVRTAKVKFDAMLQLGIARPTQSSYAFPLHLVPKKETNGDHAVTIIDSTQADAQTILCLSHSEFIAQFKREDNSCN